MTENKNGQVTLLTEAKNVSLQTFLEERTVQNH